MLTNSANCWSMCYRRLRNIELPTFETFFWSKKMDRLSQPTVLPVTGALGPENTLVVKLKFLWNYMRLCT